jgi:hypothetical protein
MKAFSEATLLIFLSTEGSLRDHSADIYVKGKLSEKPFCSHLCHRKALSEAILLTFLIAENSLRGHSADIFVNGRLSQRPFC